MLLSGIEIIWEGINLQRLFVGFGVTLKIAFVSIVISLIFGVILGVFMTSKQKWVRVICKVYLETIRVVPIIVWLFVFYYQLTKVFGMALSPETASIVVFSLWGVAEMGDLVRSAIISLPPHQKQSGMALGLSEIQIYIYITVPQAIRRIIPAAINLITRMIKTTPLVILINVVEVLKVGQQIIEISVLDNKMASFWIYGFLFFVYFIICYPIALASRRLEARWRD